MSQRQRADGRFRDYLNTASLTLKMVLVTVLVGVAVWAALDYRHSRDVTRTVQMELTAQAARAAAAGAAGVTRLLQAYRDGAELLAQTRSLTRHVQAWPDSPPSDGTAVIHRRRPAWLPTAALLGGLLPLRYVLLLDGNDRVREVYQGMVEAPPPQLLQLPDHVINASRDGSCITKIDGRPFVLAAAGVGGDRSGTLLLAAPLDSEFLAASSVPHDGHGMVAVVTMHRASVVVSSMSGLLPAGTPLPVVSQYYLLGSSPLPGILLDGTGLRFVAGISRAQVRARTTEMLGADRSQRALAPLAFVIAFAVIMAVLTQRITRLARRVQAFSARMGITMPLHSDGDPLRDLERRFQRLTEEIICETAALEHQALHDALTDLPNRLLLQDRLEQGIRAGEREGAGLALLVMDLDRFKEINDTLGHYVGDRLLAEVGRRIQEILRRADTIARLGGDEFAVLLPTADRKEAAEVCGKILDTLDRPIGIDSHNLYVGISIGVALYPEHGSDATTLMQRGDVAMYIAKHESIGFAIYDPEQDRHSISRLSLMRELRDAVDSDGLDVYYQPIVDIRAGRVCGAEALVRWRRRDGTFVSPEEFIPLAEQTGVIRPLTEWVFNRALGQAAAWRREGLDIFISLNLSARLLRDIDLPQQIDAMIEHHGMAADRVVLEVTESAIMSDPLTARRTLMHLADMGVHLSIDDFGTGYSSLAYLKQLPVHGIKIDKSFIINMARDDNDAVIVRATIDMAHNLGLKVVAEGVETGEIWDLLYILRCDTTQGYFIHRPVPAAEFRRWLHDNHGTFDYGPEDPRRAAIGAM